MRTRTALPAVVLGGAVLLGGCSTLEESARDVGRSAVDAGREAAAREAEELLGGTADQVLEGALDQLPGTCADWSAAPVVLRTSSAELVARAVLLRTGETGAPTTEQVTATASAVDVRCADAAEGTAVRDVALAAAADAGLPVAEAEQVPGSAPVPSDEDADGAGDAGEGADR